MKKDIQKAFLAAYQLNGVVNMCIDAIKHHNDLYDYPDGVSVQTTEEAEKYYKKVLPDEVESIVKVFDATVLDFPNSPLIEEISNNLNECETMQDKERYLYTLIVPFNELSKLFSAEQTYKNQLDGSLAGYENEWNTYADALRNQNCSDEQINQRLEFINVKKERARQRFERQKMIGRRFFEIIANPTNYVEDVLYWFWGLSRIFADQLDALCLQNGIDFEKLQKDCGVYLKSHRVITDVDWYIGSRELARKYIDELPKENDTQQNDSDTDKNAPQLIHLSDEVLKWLSETKCTNGKTYIENATDKPLKWLQNKQLARELLTHQNIKGGLKVADIERITPTLFVDEKGNPLNLAKSKPTLSKDSDNLSNFLATLQTPE